MPSRSGVDGQQGSHVIVELKSVPRGRPSRSSVWLSHLLPPRTRWFHLLPLACLLAVGAAVPRFLMTLVLLLAGLAAALALFVVLIQLPVGYLVHRWRDRREGKERPEHASRGASSNGL
jgi:hypothetical protein